MVLDMDFLMDFHYPKALEQPGETGAKGYPLSEQFDRLVTSFVSNLGTQSPIVWENRGNVDSERRVGHAKELSPIGKFLKNHAEEMKRDFFTVMNFRKNRQTGVRRTERRDRRSLRRRGHALAKRFYVSRKIHHFPKAHQRFKVDPFGKWSWTPWHTNGHLVNMTKRDTSNRRMKLSDILTRAGFKKDKEEAIKVVLPLLLSDLKENPPKGSNSGANGEQAQSLVVSTSNGKSSRQMKNFKVKGDDGKEFSFSASAADVQQLMDILAKPNSSVLLEKVSMNKNRTALKTQTDKTKPPGRKKTSSFHKTKDAASPNENANNTELLQLKEFESSVFENVLQVDLPCKQKSASDATTECETSTAGETNGS